MLTLLALWGMRIGLRANGTVRFVSLLMLIWLLLIIEFSCIGVIGRLLPPVGDLTNAPNLARHGLILPFIWFGGIALLRLWDARVSKEFKARLRRAVYGVAAVAAALLIFLAAAFQPLLDSLGFPPPGLTKDELAAMAWLRDNTPPDAIVMAADGNAWLPIFAERRAVDFRAARYFEWDVLTRTGESAIDVSYVYVPADAETSANMRLNLVFEQADARVYEVVGG